jgi:hypothetical protein
MCDDLNPIIPFEIGIFRSDCARITYNAIKWLVDNNIYIQCTEMLLCRGNIVGHIDLLCYDYRGEEIILDWKTGKSSPIKIEKAGCQLGLYSAMYKHNTKAVVVFLDYDQGKADAHWFDLDDILTKDIVLNNMEELCKPPMITTDL